MAWTDSIPAMGNDITSDISAIASNFAYLKALRMPGFWVNLQIDCWAVTIGYTCGAAVLTNGTDYVCCTGFSGEINMATTGADALDTGTIAADTTYFIYLIFDGTNKKGLASISATSPAMPAGYTYKLLIGAFKTLAAAAWFPVAYQRGNHLVFEDFQTVSAGTGAESWTDVDCSNFLPAAGVDLVSFSATNTASKIIKLRQKGSSTSTGAVLSTGAIGTTWCATNSRFVQINVSDSTVWTLYITGYYVNI